MMGRPSSRISVYILSTLANLIANSRKLTTLLTINIQVYLQKTQYFLVFKPNYPSSQRLVPILIGFPSTADSKSDKEIWFQVSLSEVLLIK